VNSAAEYQLVAFDLDDTLAESKSPVQADMAAALTRLLAVRPVCVISGGKFEQFEKQLLANLPADANLSRLHLMPTCGTRYLRHDGEAWREVHFHGLSDDQKQRAMQAVESQAQRLGFWEPDEKVRGSRIEDRGSQITYSALGQQALVADKKAWDPDGTKRATLRAAIAPLLPDLDVRGGGSTSIDITLRGVDKAYGIQELSRNTGIGLDQMLFIGDRLEPGGNDRPVYDIGVDCQAVSGPAETLRFVNQIVDEMSN